MIYYKVENEQLIKAPEKSLKIVITDPTNEQYKFFGYTDIIIEDEKPIVEDGKSLQEYYEQKDGVIYKHYNIIDTSENEVI